MPDLQELHWTNEPKAERLSARAGAGDCSLSRDTVIHSAAGRYSEESSRIRRRINNISVKSCEKHSNCIYMYVCIYTVGTESIQTPLNFSLCYIAAIC